MRLGPTLIIFLSRSKVSGMNVMAFVLGGTSHNLSALIFTKSNAFSPSLRGNGSSGGHALTTKKLRWARK